MANDLLNELYWNIEKVRAYSHYPCELQLSMNYKTFASLMIPQRANFIQPIQYMNGNTLFGYKVVIDEQMEDDHVGILELKEIVGENK